VGETIAINALEYVTLLIINYEAATQATSAIKNPLAPEYPVLLNQTDKALSRILCNQMINNKLRLNAAHIAGKENIIADQKFNVLTHKIQTKFQIIITGISPTTMLLLLPPKCQASFNNL
jgi:hypothetical protein